MGHLSSARQIVQQEIDALVAMREALDEEFDRAVDLLFRCEGRVVVTGVGKAGIIGQKISATLASTGTPSHWMHAVEARHGDLGRVQPGDVVLALSNSGETEAAQLLPSLKKLNVPVVAITGNRDSTLGRWGDVVLSIGKVQEACPLGLAPSCSTTAMLVLGDALALTLFGMRNWQPQDYAFYHPGGELGRSLLTVREVLRPSEANPCVQADATVLEALRTMGGRGSFGALNIVDEDGKLVGFFTDGDFRRLMQAGDGQALHRPVEELMSRNPKSIMVDSLAAEAYRLMRDHRIDQVPVIDAEGRAVGILDVQDWLDVERGGQVSRQG
jgi:arabinose-5-phosphate isomerase